MKGKQAAGLVAAAVAMVILGVGNTVVKQAVSLVYENGEWTDEEYYGEEDGGYEESFTFPEEPFVERIDVRGEITGEGSYDVYYYGTYYDHPWTMDLIDALKEDENNRGILLYIDSPGGRMYESDELYMKLKRYKEETGRPIRAYLASEACSGGYYVSLAADHLVANRNSLVGSIGVIVTVDDYSKMLEDMGIAETNFVSGRNKAMTAGNQGLTEEQAAIFQAMVDESYDQFVEVVAQEREMSADEVKELADGRFYTAKQALENGLVDEINFYEDAEADFLKELGVEIID